MKIMGTVRTVCAKEEGQSANGNFWEKQQLVLDVATGEKTIPVAVGFFGERRTRWLKELSVGQLVEVAFAPESREYNGRWYTELVCFGIIPYQKQPTKEKNLPIGTDETVSAKLM